MLPSTTRAEHWRQLAVWKLEAYFDCQICYTLAKCRID